MAKQSRLARVLGEIEAIVGWTQDQVLGERGSGPFRIVPYRGHGTPTCLRVRGRVLEGDPIPPARLEDSAWRNFLNTVRRIRSNEVPAARVRVRLGGRAWDALTDPEGYFNFQLEVPPGTLGSGLWHDVEMELLHPVAEDGRPCRTTGRVLIPTRTAGFGIISDIDDTVVKTDVANLLSMARLVLLTNAHTRLPFEGVAAFYRALHAGPEGAHANPVFYVSSSPWNFYGLLDEVFTVHGIPSGPLFLKDYGFSGGQLLAAGHQEHKLEAIEEILQVHADLPFVLIGDSGQEDPEIYREVVRRYPGRVRAIYIRDVTSGQRDREVHAIADEVAALGAEMVLVEDTVAAARHAVALGLIDPDAMPEIRGDQAADEAAPGPLESVIRPD